MTLQGASILSHEPREASFQLVLDAMRAKIRVRGDLPHASVERQLELLEGFSQFELGRFLIERGGLNGYWTHYVVTHPANNHFLANPLESFLLNQAPTALAAQQRFAIFKTLIQNQLRDGCSFASIPSGLMGEFLDLDFSNISACTLYAIDLDPETLSQAGSYAKQKGLSDFCRFYERDAWNLGFEGEFDLIESSGLTVYEPDDKKVTDLFAHFHRALKPNGILITSFLTPPPEWRQDRINPEDAALQKILFTNILEVKWQVFRAEEAFKAMLKEAGFSSVEIFYDDAHIFPTAVAKY